MLKRYARLSASSFLMALFALSSFERRAQACPVIAQYRVDFPQDFNLCSTGTWSPMPTGIERTLLPPPPGATIVKARLHAVFVTNALCAEDFDVGNLLFLLARSDGVEWIVHAGTDFAWSGSSGTFEATIETDTLNGFSPDGFWHDLYFAAVATRVSGHFHHSVAMPDAYWEVDYIDPNAVDGDVDCDGRIGYADITAFATALVNADAYADAHPDCHIMSADMDCDEILDGRDVQLFTDLLLNAPLNGRCCISDGSCEELLESECVSVGGSFGGVWTPCEEGACPLSTPVITDVIFNASPGTNCDGDLTNTGFVEISGSGFHPESFIEFTRAGEDSVFAFGADWIDRSLIQIAQLPLGCFPAAGTWDVRVTNPDGGHADFVGAVTLTSCPGQPFELDQVQFTPTELLTCPGDDVINPSSELLVDFFGDQLPPDLATQSFDSQVRVNLVDASTGEEWFSLFASDVVLVSPGHYQVTFLITHGNVLFPTSNPPAGEYTITITGCAQAVQASQTVVIREECPPEP